MKDKKTIYEIRLIHVDNSKGVEKLIFKKRLESLDKRTYRGFIEEKIFITTKGRIIIEKDLIKGTFTKLINKKYRGVKIPKF